MTTKRAHHAHQAKSRTRIAQRAWIVVARHTLLSDFIANCALRPWLHRVTTSLALHALPRVDRHRMAQHAKHVPPASTHQLANAYNATPGTNQAPTSQHAKVAHLTMTRSGTALMAPHASDVRLVRSRTRSARAAMLAWVRTRRTVVSAQTVWTERNHLL